MERTGAGDSVGVGDVVGVISNDVGGDLDGVTNLGEIFGLSSSFLISWSIVIVGEATIFEVEFCGKTSTVKVLSFSRFFLDLKESLSIVLWNNEVFSFFLKTLILSINSSSFVSSISFMVSEV